MAVIRYPSICITTDNETAHLYAMLIRKIIEAGDTQWLSVQTVPKTSGDNMPTDGACDLLISHGVPVAIEFDDAEGSQAHLDALINQYLQVPDADDAENDAGSAGS